MKQLYSRLKNSWRTTAQKKFGLLVYFFLIGFIRFLPNFQVQEFIPSPIPVRLIATQPLPHKNSSFWCSARNGLFRRANNQNVS